VLFVGHDASRSGAPLSLLHVQQWLRTHTSWRFETLLCGDGPLTDDYRAVGPVTLLPRWRGGLPHLAHRARRRWLLERLRSRCTLVYANTITSGLVVQHLSRQRPVLTHVRELEPAIEESGPRNLRAVLAHTAAWVACADVVKQNLCARHDVAPGRVRVIRSSIEPLGPTADSPAPEDIRARLGIPRGVPVVGGCGALARHKGPDLFVEVAGAVARVAPARRPHFVWVGAGGPERIHALRALAAERGVAGRVHFVGERPRVHDYFQIFDLFAVVSRSDSHPRVCVEAASLGVPGVCFAAGGGISEFIEDDAGLVVPGLDVETMAAALSGLMGDPHRRRMLGDRAAAKAAARHHISVVGPEIALAIASALAGPPGGRLLPHLAGPAAVSSRGNTAVIGTADTFLTTSGGHGE
jgi:glycosyltransferase involved in cell wall biosynthesis